MQARRKPYLLLLWLRDFIIAIAKKNHSNYDNNHNSYSNPGSNCKNFLNIKYP